MKYAIEKRDTKLYPLITENHIRKSAQALYEDRSRIPFHWRKEAARNIAEAAIDTNIDIPYPEYILSLTSEGICDIEKAANAIIDRAFFAEAAIPGNKGKEAFEGYVGLASDVVNEVESSGTADLDKLASVIAAYDESNNLHHHYDQIPTPEELLYNISPLDKEAEDKSSFELRDGTTVNVDNIPEGILYDVSDLVGGRFESAIDESPLLNKSAEEKKDLLACLDKKGCAILKRILRQRAIL